MIKKIGFIGLGLMGKPMSLNLVRAGYDVTVYNRTPQKTEPLAEAGASVASNPKEAAAGADAVITMLLEDSNVEEVILGKNGVIESLSEGAIVVDMSTISPITVRKITAALEEKGNQMLDAPVSGGPIGAEEASLAIMVGGKAEDLERILPVFQVMGKNITHVGDHGTGQVAKAANQIIVALTLAAVSEALIFSKGAGADPAKVREALMGGFAQSRILELHGKRMLDRDFVPGSKVYTTKKDIEISMTIARKEGICLPSTAFVSHLWNACAAKGGMDWDHAAIVKILEEMSDIEVTPGAK
ncbi:2-hydroxy-3-oxopropionate reductase [Thermodesulfobacteriota bacterium]